MKETGEENININNREGNKKTEETTTLLAVIPNNPTGLFFFFFCFNRLGQVAIKSANVIARTADYPAPNTHKNQQVSTPSIFLCRLVSSSFIYLI